MSLGIIPPPEMEADPYVWKAEVGMLDQWEPAWPVLLGQVGFLDALPSQ